MNQIYFRTKTLTQANAVLVDYNTKLSLAKIRGGGEAASADGLRFVIPVKTINSRSNSKYLGTGRGITYYNYTSDQFTGFNGIVISGTIRDSLYLLQGILEQQTMLHPKEIITDTAILYLDFWGYLNINLVNVLQILVQQDFGDLIMILIMKY
ncbi:Tn3 family transposase [Clostridium sp. HV4-5-A1G]|nr:Tn3 family transposase [Clostridium sp. HV4-5-A1G]